MGLRSGAAPFVAAKNGGSSGESPTGQTVLAIQKMWQTAGKFSQRVIQSIALRIFDFHVGRAIITDRVVVPNTPAIATARDAAS